MAFDPLAFSRGLLEGAVEVKQAEADRREKIQEQIRKAQLKAVETQMESYNKRRSTYNSIQSARKSGDYNTAMLYAIKDSGLDYDDIGKVVDTSDPEKVKAYLNSWEKEFMAIPEPNYEQAVEDSYKYTEKERGIVSTTLRSWLGIEPDEVMYSAAKSHRPPPFQGSVEDDRPTGPIPLKDKASDLAKPKHFADTAEVGGEKLPRITTFTYGEDGRPVILGTAIGPSRGPAKVAPQLDKDTRTSISGMVDSRINELKESGAEEMARMLDEGIGGRTGKTGKVGGLQHVWKQMADELRRDPSVDPVMAYQLATQELEEMWRLGLIQEEENYGGWGKSDYSVIKNPNARAAALIQMYKDGKLTKEELAEARRKYIPESVK